MSSLAFFKPSSRMMDFVMIVGLIAFVVCGAEARRYRYCAEGCCMHEYCAYRKICYPKIHCSLGCPDGTCVKGVCMPPSPCNDTTPCGLGHACQFNFNLGYRTCQYNLDLGNSLCVDRHGQPVLKFT